MSVKSVATRIWPGAAKAYLSERLSRSFFTGISSPYDECPLLRLNRLCRGAHMMRDMHHSFLGQGGERFRRSSSQMDFRWCDPREESTLLLARSVIEQKATVVD